MSRQLWSGAIAMGVVLAVAGCSGGDQPSATPGPTAAPSSSTTEAPTPEEAAAQAAMPVFTELLRVFDQARQNPGARDWEPEIRRYAADPAAYLAVQSAREYATLGLRQRGNSKVDLELTDVQLAAPEGPSVRLAGCYDSTSTQVIRADTGEAVPPGTAPRYIWDVTVVQYRSEPGAPWLVTTLDPITDRPC